MLREQSCRHSIEEFLGLKQTTWAGRVALYNVAIMYQRMGDIANSKIYFEEFLSLNDKTIHFQAYNMRFFLDLSSCNWTTPLLPQKENHPSQIIPRVGDFHVRTSSNQIRVGYVFDGASNESIIQIPQFCHSSKFKVYQYPIHFHQTNGIAEQINIDNILILVVLNESSCPIFTDILKHRIAPFQVSFGCAMYDTVDLNISYDFGPTSNINAKTLPLIHDISNTQLLLVDNHNLRAKYLLDDDNFIYASFCQPQDIDLETFKVWMKILVNTCEASILLLLRHNDAMETNLRREAKTFAVQPERLVFLDCPESKCQLCELNAIPDLFLDSFVEHGNKHALCEALLSGTPVLSMQPEGHKSILNKVVNDVGLEHLITKSQDQYLDLAISLQFHEHEFIEVIRRLDERRGSIEDYTSNKWMFDYEEILQSLLPIK